jgi:hypothetical protein
MVRTPCAIDGNGDGDLGILWRGRRRHIEEEDWMRKVQVTGEAEKECVKQVVGARTRWIAWGKQ